MYTPSFFAEARVDVLHGLIDAHPLGALVMLHDGARLDADHLPFEIAPPSAQAPFGVLRAHVARANPLWRHEGAQVLVLFQGPSAYVSPGHDDKAAVSGKIVPTWNYAVVHARGKLRTVDDPQWLLGLLERMTTRHESTQAMPWKIDDAPRDYIDGLLEAIVGIEIPIDQLLGKWKVSQNRSPARRERIIASLATEHRGSVIAALMRGLEPTR